MHYAKNTARRLKGLVHAIDGSISPAPNVRVEARKRLPGKDTGRLREHDVILTFSVAHHECQPGNQLYIVGIQLNLKNYRSLWLLLG
jgi:hypothetical protein